MLKKALTLLLSLAATLAMAAVDVNTASEADLDSIKGIGPWTQSYILLRGYGVLDGSMHGDVVVRKRLGALLNLPEAPDQAFTQQWLAQFGSWKALVAAHLWAMPADTQAKDY